MNDEIRCSNCGKPLSNNLGWNVVLKKAVCLSGWPVPDWHVEAINIIDAYQETERKIRTRTLPSTVTNIGDIQRARLTLLRKLGCDWRPQRELSPYAAIRMKKTPKNG